MESLRFLRYYITGLFIFKIIYIILVFRNIHLKIEQKRSPSTDNNNKIQNTEYIKSFVDTIFLTGTYLLMIYIFNPWKHRGNILNDNHVKILLFSTGVISFLHMLQNIFNIQ